MPESAVVVTGSNGGIGSAIVEAMHAEGWFVIGIDRNPDDRGLCDGFVQYDLAECMQSDGFKANCIAAVLKLAGDRPIKALVNNAATQILGSTGDIQLEEWQETMTVNLTAPFLLSQALLPDLRKVQGAILNVGSVHSQATKKGFVSYATSKAALQGLTRALAVDLGPDVRVNCLAPAAIATDMLKAGFEDDEEAFRALESAHPLCRIGSCEEAARAACFMLSEHNRFLTGSCLYLDGGILSRLHDPI